MAYDSLRTSFLPRKLLLGSNWEVKPAEAGAPSTDAITQSPRRPSVARPKPWRPGSLPCVASTRGCASKRSGLARYARTVRAHLACYTDQALASWPGDHLCAAVRLLPNSFPPALLLIGPCTSWRLITILLPGAVGWPVAVLLPRALWSLRLALHRKRRSERDRE